MSFITDGHDDCRQRALLAQNETNHTKPNEYTRSLSLLVGCVVPVLRKFVQDFVPNIPAAASMLALLVVVDMLLLAQFGGIDGATLEASILQHLTLQQACYGLDLWIAKSHYVLHLGKMLKNFLPACFVQERRHRMIKRYANDRHNTTNYEHGLLEQLTVQHLHDLGTPWVGAFSQEPHDPSKRQQKDLQAVIGPSLDNVKVSSSCRIKGKLICANDVVRYTSQGLLAIGQIKYFIVASNGDQYARLAPWAVMEKTEQVVKKGLSMTVITKKVPRGYGTQLREYWAKKSMNAFIIYSTIL